MITWRILSWVAEYTESPQRLAGTCNRYSKKAMPQLARITSNSGLFLNFKCPYQAKVMKTFEQIRSTIGSQRDCVKSFIIRGGDPAERRCSIRQVDGALPGRRYGLEPYGYFFLRQ